MGGIEYKAGMNLQKQLFAVVREHDLLPYGTGILVVGVSGGTDSLALLHALYEAEVRLHVATLDHGLRGEAGAQDARFVVETAGAWGLPVTAGYTDVRALAAARRVSIEAAARIARYDFLASVARAVGAARIAVAHNADDQVETILLHLLRGSGLSGLAGMEYEAPLPGHPDLTLIRPLLDVPRAELEAYCREQDLQPRYDASNADASYTRNRLRLDLLPHLRELSPQIDRRLLQLAEIVGVEDDFADGALHAALDDHVVQSEGRVGLPHSVFERLHPALQRRFVVWAAQSLGAADVGYVHIAAAVRLGMQGTVGARAQLKGGVQLRVDYDAVVVEHEDAPLADDLPLLPPDAEIPVIVPGVTRVNSSWVLISSWSVLEGAGSRLAVSAGSTMVLRVRRAGDRFAPLGLGGHTQKISKRMIDAAVPRRLRERLPLLIVNGKIAALWWQRWTVSEEFAASERSGRSIYFRFQRNYDDARENT